MLRTVGLGESEMMEIIKPIICAEGYSDSRNSDRNKGNDYEQHANKQKRVFVNDEG